MATKKSASKAKPVAKKTTVKKVEKKPVNKTAVKKAKAENSSILSTNISIVLAMAIEALILLLGYLIIMSV